MLALVLLLCPLHCALAAVGQSVAQTAQLNVTYEGRTGDTGMPSIYAYTVAQGSVLRVQIVSGNASLDTPLIAVARGTQAIRSAKLPLLLQSQYAFSDVSLTLCPLGGTLPSGGNATLPQAAAEQLQVDHGNGTVFVELSSGEPAGLHFALVTVLLPNIVLGVGTTSAVRATPSAPLVRYFAFAPAESTVLVQVRSTDESCMVASVQPALCPLFDQWENVQLRGLHQTVTKQGAITVQKKDFPEFYLVLVVAGNDLACIGRNSMIPLAPVLGSTRTKYVQITVEYVPDDEQYIVPISATFVAIALVYVLFIGWSVAFERRRAAEFRRRMPLLLAADTAQCDAVDAEGAETEGAQGHAAHGDDGDDGDGLAGGEREPLVPDDSAAVVAPPPATVYGATGESDAGQPDDDVVVVTHRRIADGSDADAPATGGLDRQTRSAFRNAVPLMVSHLSAKTYRQRDKKYTLYIWNLLTICCFYGLPVVQLVFVWQTTMANSGNLDLCWYNELCTRHFFGISAFNNVFSNIGYVMLGLLFIVLVAMRDIRYSYETMELGGDQSHAIGRYGPPQHFGLLYCIGVAIMMEGVLSASYHICPSSTNFQFDTAFMYMIAALGLLRIYQMRHPDINANSHVAYATMAGIILFGMAGVYFNGGVLYALFAVFYCVLLVSASCEFYYKGAWKLDGRRIVQSVAAGQAMLLPAASLPLRLWRFIVPTHKGRMLFVLLGNAANVALLIYGLLRRPSDFPTFLLTVFITNLLLYTFYYIVMKLRFKEGLSVHSCIVILLAAFAWAVSMFFFMQKSTSWHLPPAESRTLNSRCVLLDFYDHHDCWHFSSAMALFLSFTTLLCIDDNVRFVPHNALRVF